MKIVGLLSGGKDSIYALMQCAAMGHKIRAVATLFPPTGIDESNSHMYQSVAVRHVSKMAEALGKGVQFFSRTIEGTSVNISADYSSAIQNDEVEDLYKLLTDVKDNLPEVEGVSVGAILSDYQRKRVEHVCGRLGLVCFSYLWQRNQEELLNEMVATGLEAVLVKVASAGLEPKKHCGATIADMVPQLKKLNSKFGVHVCGEGGEFETFTLDCPLFEKKLKIVSSDLVEESGDVGYLVIKEMTLEDKPDFDHSSSMQDRALKAGVPVPKYCTKGTETIPNSSANKSAIVSNNVTVVAGGSVSVPPKGTKGVWTASSWRGDCVESVLTQMRDCLSKEGISLSSACELKAYVHSLSEYAAFNAVYKQFFGYSPPVRACVQVPATYRCQLDVVGAVGCTRDVLHVQSISHWAPANIGPYSQTCTIGGQTFIAGMIGMVPGTLDLISSDVTEQTELCLKHIDTVLCGEHTPYLVTVFTTSATDSSTAMGVVPPSLMTLCVEVERLPKDARVELHATANRERTSVERIARDSHEEQRCSFSDGGECRIFKFGDSKDTVEKVLREVLSSTSSTVTGVLTLYSPTTNLPLAEGIVTSLGGVCSGVTVTSVPVTSVSGGACQLSAVLNLFPCL